MGSGITPQHTIGTLQSHCGHNARRRIVISVAMLQMALRVGTKPHVWEQQGRPLNALEGLVEKNASIHQEEASMSVENTLKNNSALQRDSAHAVGRSGSAPRVIANNQRDNVLGVV